MFIEEEVYGRTDKYEVIEGLIPSDYAIWNAHLLRVDGKVYLKLYNKKRCIGDNVDMNSLLALEVDEETAKIIDEHLAGGRNPQEVKRHLRCKDGWAKRHGEAIKPYVEKLLGIEIEA